MSVSRAPGTGAVGGHTGPGPCPSGAVSEELSSVMAASGRVDQRQGRLCVGSMRWGTGSRLWVTWDGRTRLGCDEALGYNTACPSVGAKVGRAGCRGRGHARVPPGSGRGVRRAPREAQCSGSWWLGW